MLWHGTLIWLLTWLSVLTLFLPWPNVSFLPGPLMYVVFTENYIRKNLYCMYTSSNVLYSIVDDHEHCASMHRNVITGSESKTWNVLNEFLFFFPGPKLLGKEGEVWVPEEQTLSYQTKDSWVQQGGGLERRQINTDVQHCHGLTWNSCEVCDK